MVRQNNDLVGLDMIETFKNILCYGSAIEKLLKNNNEG